MSADDRGGPSGVAQLPQSLDQRTRLLRNGEIGVVLELVLDARPVGDADPRPRTRFPQRADVPAEEAPAVAGELDERIRTLRRQADAAARGQRPATRAAPRRAIQVEKVRQLDVRVLRIEARAERQRVEHLHGDAGVHVDRLQVRYDGLVAADPLGVPVRAQAKRRIDAEPDPYAVE